MANNLLEFLGAKPTAWQHWDPHLAIGLSAICLGAPACAFLAIVVCILQVMPPPYSASVWVHLVSYSILCGLYGLAAVFCALADYVYIKQYHRSFYGKVDIMWASLTFFWSNADLALRAGPLEPAILSTIAVATFLFSGRSKSFDQWVFRHSFWHLVAGCLGVYGAFRLAPAAEVIALVAWSTFLKFFGAYAATALLAVLAWRRLPASLREAMWHRGAVYANWKMAGKMK